jgi:hypothetical protein
MAKQRSAAQKAAQRKASLASARKRRVRQSSKNSSIRKAAQADLKRLFPGSKSYRKNMR